jgi:hypothetical protein
MNSFDTLNYFEISIDDGLRDLKYDLWKWEWDLWWVNDFMKCLLIYESDMLLKEWTWKKKYYKFYSMKHEHDYV